MTLLDEGETTCCYARSEKHWVTDPQGIAWEHFHTLGNIPVFNEAPAHGPSGSTCCAPAEAAETASSTVPAACCALTPRGKPIGIPVTSAASCC